MSPLQSRYVSATVATNTTGFGRNLDNKPILINKNIFVVSKQVGVKECKLR
ncbi:hypothetical protein SBF1_610004 [Candidatus Desulfosporosinus infrequens]|uniref:Uncharacterized protein n=1 Tax=Candidatus Desulfosporosinus infrequens TaxID=2043169 RepID=A0A2U3LLH3_9FIRM|nr:hypothetical protein SBF1_610004 [Candidatus Desulfosporosinus infrequens]